MKARHFSFLYLFVCVAALLYLAGCGDDSPLTENDGFEIHEWGVLAGCSGDDSYFLTSRPESVMIVREPVIYVHADNPKPFTVTVTFNGGYPTDTYPTASVSGNKATWQNVEFAESLNSTTARGDSGYVPLEAIIGTLNNVDARILKVNNQKARFLFYEGEVPWQNRIAVDLGNDTVAPTVTNNGQYPVYNLVLVTFPAGSCSTGARVTWYKESLNPGEQFQFSFVHLDTVITPWYFDLVASGFSSMEAQAFVDLWRLPFLNTMDCQPNANLIYRFSRQEYDDLITLAISPPPEKVVRSLYVLVHLQE
ncbi:MAG: hypothetical protein KAT58_07275 [candidate division Zixibacteria bacterium]|nr:hypothetical protein [candidate division Zixibacteria bacterium]